MSSPLEEKERRYPLWIILALTWFFLLLVEENVTLDAMVGTFTSDAGILLVGLADKKLSLTEAMAGCVKETRQRGKVVHSFP